jgi:hypothetical protein
MRPQRLDVFDPSELALIRQNISTMVQELDESHHQSLDALLVPKITTSWTVKTGRPGRPRKEVDVEVLQGALTHWPLTKTAPTFECSARTLTRRLQDAGLKEVGPPVYVEVEDADGIISKQYTSTGPRMTEITDEELDGVVSEILQDFPNFGQSMIAGSLSAMGIRVPSARQRESRLRVHGAPGVFSVRRLERRRYKVPGANSFWHHDGQHGAPQKVPRVYQTYPSPSSDSLEDRHSWVYRRLFSPYHWPPCLQ